MQRRAERGQPLANRYAQRMKQLPGNIKDDWDDEAPEWQEEDEISDYNHFVGFPILLHRPIINSSTSLFPTDRGIMPSALKDSYLPRTCCSMRSGTGRKTGLFGFIVTPLSLVTLKT